MNLDRYEKDLTIFGFFWIVAVAALIYAFFAEKPDPAAPHVGSS